jgi:hypothetical protein
MAGRWIFPLNSEFEKDNRRASPLDLIIGFFSMSGRSGDPRLVPRRKMEQQKEFTHP